jgi:hypothetical protein
MFISILFVDIIIILFALETKVYSDILTALMKIIPHIIMAFIILAPLGFMSAIIDFCNLLSVNLAGPNIIQAVNEYNLLMDFKKFGLDLIIYSPTIILLSCFFLPTNWELMFEVINIKTMESEFKKLKISLIFNYISIIFLVVYLFIDIFYLKSNFPAKIIQYIKTIKYNEFNKYPDDMMRMSLIILLGIIYYMWIFWVTIQFVDPIFNNDTLHSVKTKKYKILIFIPFINIFIIYLINKNICSAHPIHTAEQRGITGAPAHPFGAAAKIGKTSG